MSGSLALFLLVLLIIAMVFVFTMVELNRFEETLTSFCNRLKDRYNMEEELKRELEAKFSDTKKKSPKT
jgi:predicted Holliday junction resolvase-like endonuclease